MVLYLSRDYLTQNTTTANRSNIPSYLISIFLRRILKYTYVGDTAYNINSVGTLLIATGDTTPTVAPTFSAGNKAGIVNNGASIEVSIPSSIRTVQAGDVGRILVLKSSLYPTRNSGLFLITAINTTGGVNRYVIDYRGNGDLALAEAADTVEWYLYEKDLNCPGQGANNSGTGYRGNGTSTTPRIILQSPHSVGWQVRICNETTTDAQINITCSFITCAPGFGGNSAGDFAVGGDHLHTALFYDTANSDFMAACGCGDNASLGPQYRVTMFGDDTGQSFHIFARRPLNASTPPSFYLSFGLPDNEPVPLPIKNIRRLFVLGNGATNNTGVSRLNDVNLSVGSYTQGLMQGSAFYLQPISCAPSLLAYLTTNSQQAGPAFDSLAGDSPFLSATELMPVDLVAGTVQSWGGGTTVALPYYPKTMGTLPLVMAGRTNFGDYTLTTDSASWTANAATNASPIQITTSTTNTLVTGQTVAINGATGNTAANGTWVVTVINNTQFTLNGSTGNGTFSGTATVLRGASNQHMRRGIYIPWNGPAVVP
jgi:hypothetical protein